MKITTAKPGQQVKRSFCRICIAGCGTLVTVEGDQVISVKGDPDHPLSNGYMCPKGRSLGDMHHDPNRLDGAFIGRPVARVSASHKDAARDAGAALQKVVDEHGAESIGFFTGTGGFVDPAAGFASRKFRQKLGVNQIYSTATVDAISKLFAISAMAGTSALVPHLDKEANLVVFVGSNPVVSHGQSTGFPDPIERMRSITRRGGQIWVVDPRRTETATHADRFVAPIPGSDYALLAYLIRDVIIRRENAAASFGADRHRFEELRTAVEPFNKAKTCAITGLDQQDLEDLAAAVDQNGQVAVVTGTGTSMSETGNLTEWFAWALMILTDSFEKPGGMWFNPGFFARLDERPVLPATPPMPSVPSMPSVVNVAGEWPSSLIPAEIEAGRLKALVVMGGNMIGSLPDTIYLKKMLEHLDVVIVLELFDNNMADQATHLFACPDQLERPDLIGLDLYVPALATQYADAVVPASEGRPPAWRTLALIAEAMNLDLLGSDLGETTTEDVLARVARGADFDKLVAANGPVVESTEVHEWAQSRLPNGHWDLAPDVLVEQLLVQQDIEATSELVLIPRRQVKRFNNHEYRASETPDAWLNPRDAGPLSIADGDNIVVRSHVGSLELVAKVTDRIRPGVVSVPHGYDDINVNRLISASEINSMNGMPVMSGTVVEVELRQAASS